MSIKERVPQELNTLIEADLEQVGEYVAFLKFRAWIKPMPGLDQKQLAALDAELADEDRQGGTTRGSGEFLLTTRNKQKKLWRRTRPLLRTKPKPSWRSLKS